ncbi:phage tail protein [Marinomonas sp. THO17]|uniref:phage tail-collar fiber domain-containing protein n=1 Tax=Marinomonas sp. THO17 TaxID=3149048 RepID=UPI00336BC191
MSFLTQAGEAQIANKQGNASRMTMSHFVLANVPDLGAEPSDRVAELPRDEQIVQTLPYTKHSYLNPNQVVYSLIMDSTIGDFTFNWIGLVDEEEVLIAVAHITPIDKRKSTEGMEGNTIARNFLLKYSGIQNVTGANVPAETWQLDFSTRFNGMDERERLSNLDLYGQASFLDSAYQVIKEGDQYQLQAGVGYVGGIRTKLAEQETLTVSDLPCSIWLDVSLQGDVSDKTTVSQIQVQTEATSDFVDRDFVNSDYVDSNGLAHYVSKLADINTDGEITDHRVIYDNVAKHEAKANPHPQYVEYTDEQCAATLSSAQQALSEHEAKADPHPQYYQYSDTQDATTLAQANGFTEQQIAQHEAKPNPHAQYYQRQTFTLSGDENQLILSSQNGDGTISQLKDWDEFRFQVAATNTAAVTIQIDDLAPLPLRGVAAHQVFASAFLTVRYFNEGFYIAKQINPLTGNDVLDITKLWIDTVDVLRPGEYALDGSTLSRTSHPIAFAIAQASTNFIGQAVKDADPVTYGGYYGDGDGSTTFTLPIVGGEFIRMHDGGRGADAGRGFASWQGDAIRNIVGEFGSGLSNSENRQRVSGAMYFKSQDVGDLGVSQDSGLVDAIGFNASLVVPTANENRPRNLAYYGKTRL